jgi:hypothetical protein
VSATSVRRCRAVLAAALLPVLTGCFLLPWRPGGFGGKTRDETGRAAVLRALEPPSSPPGPARRGTFATAASSASKQPGRVAKGFDPAKDHLENRFELQLADGTRVGGLLFSLEEVEGSAPLLMASFGYLQDRWGTEPAKFYDLYLKDRDYRLPAHVLLLDHPTAGSFAAANRHASIGSYDDARMWIEVGQHLRQTLAPSSIHLYGVSMSGQTVVHALVEDARLGLGLFASGMAVSMAPDFREVPGAQLAEIPTPDENPWRASLEAKGRSDFRFGIQSQTVWLLVQKQFMPSYQAIRPEGVQFERDEVPTAFRRSYEARLAGLREPGPGRADWNPDFGRSDLESYMATTRIARVIDRVRTPLILVSAHNDPAVPRRLFEEVVRSATNSPWVAAYETDYGGHNGFDVPYGSAYLGRVVRLLLDVDVLGSWSEATAGP